MIRLCISIKWIVLLLFIIVILTIPTPVWAHAVLQQALPAPNSILQSAPKEIRLEFNERLQKELYTIKVYDDKGNLITNNSTLLSSNQKVISIALPELKSGVYTITYHLISADGHAVKSTYVWTLGQPTDPQKPIIKGHTHSDTIAIYSFRIVHYLFLLSLAGWLFWKPLISFISQTEEQEYKKWLRYLCHLNLFFMIQTILLHSVDSLDDITFPNIWALWTGTSVGIAWFSNLFLSIAVYWVVNQTRWKIGIWIILLLMAQAFSGHAFATDPPVLTLFLDWVHLLAASIWMGGLLFIMLFLKNHRALIIRFLPQFSKGALLSMIVLISSGTFYALILMPKIQYLFYTGWGLFLIAKLILVAAVIITGSRIRYYMKQEKELNFTIWLKRDFVLMFGILIIVGIFTYLSPVPSNNPLDWRFKSGNDQRNVSITPNAAGNNQFTVYLTKPKMEISYKSVSIELLSISHSDIAPIEIPLHLLNQSISSNNSQVEQFTFSANGPYLAFPGKWKVKLILVDAEDNKIVYDKVMRIF
jgi:copper transport protein